MVYHHTRISICHSKGISALGRHSSSHKSNVSNKRGELYPQGPFLGGLTHRSGYLCSRSGVVPELKPSLLNVRAGNVQLIPGQPVGIFEDSYNLHVVFLAVTEDVGQHWYVELTQFWEFLRDESPNTDVLESHGVQHARRGFA